MYTFIILHEIGTLGKRYLITIILMHHEMLSKGATTLLWNSFPTFLHAVVSYIRNRKYQAAQLWTLMKMTNTHYLFTSPHHQMRKTMKTMIWTPFSLTSYVCVTVVQSHLGARSVAEGVWIPPRGRQVEGEPRSHHWSHCSGLDTGCWHLLVVAGDIQVQPQVPPADKASWAWLEDTPFVGWCNSLVLNLISRYREDMFTYLWTTMERHRCLIMRFMHYMGWWFRYMM